jgi:hypothetical protein
VMGPDWASLLLPGLLLQGALLTMRLMLARRWLRCSKRVAEFLWEVLRMLWMTRLGLSRLLRVEVGMLLSRMS